MEVSVVIPNYNGIAFLDSVLASLEGQTLKNFEVIFVDNGSSDGSCSFVAGNYPWVHIIELPENYGFCKAVNEGIKASRAPYVLLLNNDTEVKEDFLEEMVAAIRRHKRAFSCAARMVQYHDRDRLDDAGNFYNALGWSFARGKGRDIHTYEKEEQIFSSCGGAAIYRRKLFEKIGYFDEEHFAYLEDTDPLTLLSVFVPASKTEALYAFLIFLRIYLAGIAFSRYSFYHKNSKQATFMGTMIYIFAGWH